MKSAKQAAVASSRLSTLHQRLYNALKLGHFIRCNDGRGHKWEYTDIGTQKLVIRSIDAFLDCVSSETLFHHPLVKDSVNDIAGVLESILEFKSESVLRLASDLAAKMVRILPGSLLELHVIYLVDNLLPLLCSQQLQVSISCATALNSILSNLSTKREKQVWEILKGRDSVVVLLKNMKDSCIGDKRTEYSQEMAVLLSQILWRWPPSRFSAWIDSEFLGCLHDLIRKPESSLKAAVLRVYSSLGLCGYGAKKLLATGKKGLLEVMVDCMNSSDSHSVQMEGFRLAQCLMVNQQGCVEVMKLCCKPLVNAIVSGMKIRCLGSEKPTKDQMSLVVEACRVALITRWVGNHHSNFWQARVDEALLDLLLANSRINHQSLHQISVEEQILVLQNGLRENFLSSLRPYIWDVIGGLVANTAEDFWPNMHEMSFELNILITCACLDFTESIITACQISQSTISNTVGSESASRAVLLMVYSPCKYIASQARLILSEVLKLNGKDYIEYLLNILNATSCRNSYLVPGNIQVVISLMSLACYASIPTYQRQVIEHQGIRTLLVFLKQWFNNPTYIKRSNLAPHLHNSFSERVCCHQSVGEWEGEDMQLLFGLWGLGQLIHNAASHGDLSDIKAELDESQICRELEDVCSNHYSPGSRWYAAYILGHSGMYGFPSNLGKRIGKAFMDNELADMELILTNLDSLHVHEIILSVRCPQLLPRQEKQLRETYSIGPFLTPETKPRGRAKTEVRLSSHVDYQSLLKLMEYVYSGYVQVSDDILKKLKLLAKHCDLQPLLYLLYRKNPRWGAPFPTFDLTPALGPAGYYSSDVLLEADVCQLEQWRCSFCSGSIPHFHVHRVVLVSSCDYMRALFKSGMQESNLQNIKLPISWGSLSKLVPWIYSDELPKPIFDCVWDNLRLDQKLNEMRSYVELCWLTEFWLLEDLHEQCFGVVASGLETDRYMPVELIQLAADFSQWKLAEIAAMYMAPLYNQLRSNGDLDHLSENIIDMVRATSVQLSQENINGSR